MIKVTRGPKPGILLRKADEWTRALLSAATGKQQENATNKYRHSEIKRALEEMFHGKCAYCESKILHVAYGHIEHFRPKSRHEYRHLTFDWPNLLLACGLCNGTEYKGDRFPETQNGGPLINPCEDDPGEHFDFVYDPRARLASVYGKTQRGKTTERVLGLNRTNLRKYRSSQIRKLAFVALKSQSDIEAKALLAEAIEDHAEYTAFARMLSASMLNR